MLEPEARVIADFARHYGITFNRPDLLKLALTHRSYLSVSGQGPRESNERLEFLGDSVLGLVTSEFLYREHPNEHEGQLTKTKSLLVSKAILSRRALAMGLGRFVLMSQSEIESGGRQRLSILADAFESVVGAIYLDQGFEAARSFIVRALLRDTREIVADKRHTNYKSHLQEYVQSTFRTHPVYRIRSELGPDHSKQFNVEVMVGRRVLGTGRGRNKKEAEQAAARNALEQVETRTPSEPRASRGVSVSEGAGLGSASPGAEVGELDPRRRRRGRRGGRGRRGRDGGEGEPRASESPPEVVPARTAGAEPPGTPYAPVSERRDEGAKAGYEAYGIPESPEDESEEIGRPEGPYEDLREGALGQSGGGGGAATSIGWGRSESDSRETHGRSVEPAGRWSMTEADEPAPEGPSPEEREAGPPAMEGPEEPGTPPEEKPADDPEGGTPPAYGRRPGRGRR